MKAWTNKVTHLGNTTSNKYVCICSYLVVFVRCFTLLLILFVLGLSILIRL